jgi:hypothetical protein
MGNLLYNRKILVEFFDKNNNGISFKSRDNLTQGFDISFNVTKNQEKEPNQSTVTIYGIGEENRKAIAKELFYVVLHAGYDENIKILSLGEISEIIHSYESPGIKTTISFQDGLKNYAESLISKTFISGTKVKDIINSLAASMNLPNPKLLDIDDSVVISSSQTLAGSSSKYLTEICDKYDLKWSIQNNKLVVKKADTQLSNTIYKINEDSGLIGSVEKKITRIPKKDKGKSNKNNDKEDLLTIKTLLMPEIIPGSIIEVSSKFFKKSLGIVDSVQHTGSNHENEFYSTIQAKMV